MAGAAGYPERAIRLIVPFSPGGQTDNVSRQLANALPPILGEQLVIDNRSGAAGTIGSAEAARADPDGYTLVMGTASTHAINPSFMSNIQYDVLKDFAPIIAVGTGPMSINVHPSVPARSLKQLIADVKSHPGEYLYGTAGVGSINHLGGEIFKARAGGLQIVHVPYKGAGPAVADMIGGQIPMTCSSLSSVLPHHRSGRVRTLAVLKEERSQGAPEIPTAIESGVENAIAYTFNMILAPAGTPREVVQRLSTAIQQVMANPDFRQRLVRIGVDPITNSDPQKAAAMLRTEIARYKPVIQALALRN
jgi:tripartite-type tricarboxylate transporter receptor subunit TctC